MTRDDLEFFAEISVRYHRRRAAFLSRVSACMSVCTLFGGAAAFATLFGADTLAAKWLTMGITFLGVVQIVAQIDRNAVIHEKWLAAWNELLFELHVTPNETEEDFRRWTEKLYRLESECVGQMKALTNQCFNQASSALGRPNEDPYILRWYHRLLIQFISFETSDYR